MGGVGSGAVGGAWSGVGEGSEAYALGPGVGELGQVTPPSLHCWQRASRAIVVGSVVGLDLPFDRADPVPDWVGLRWALSQLQHWLRPALLGVVTIGASTTDSHTDPRCRHCPVPYVHARAPKLTTLRHWAGAGTHGLTGSSVRYRRLGAVCYPRKERRILGFGPSSVMLREVNPLKRTIPCSPGAPRGQRWSW